MVRGDELLDGVRVNDVAKQQNVVLRVMGFEEKATKEFEVWLYSLFPPSPRWYISKIFSIYNVDEDCYVIFENGKGDIVDKVSLVDFLNSLKNSLKNSEKYSIKVKEGEIGELWDSLTKERIKPPEGIRLWRRGYVRNE